MTKANVVLALLILCSVALSHQVGIIDIDSSPKGPANEPPTLRHPFPKLVATAGKVFRYTIPDNIFIDPEDGSSLTYTVYETENVPLNQDSWLQYNASQRMFYGLPKTEDLSRWTYIIEAKDSEGLTARGILDVVVILHSRLRLNNHKFTMKIKPLKHYQHAIDWQIRALEGIANLHKDTNVDHLLALNLLQIGDVYEFSWINDTLLRYPCPVDDITKIMTVMESKTEHGSPSSDLINAMNPDFQVLEIRWRGIGRSCFIEPTTPKALINYPPLLRNAIDRLTAKVGHLFVYRVPEDTFYDPEDGGTKKLNLSLRFSDNSPIPLNHWLQFDAKKQEFFGVPSPNDIADTNYVLIAEDSGKKVVHDNIDVLVEMAPQIICPTVELEVTIEPTINLLYSAIKKRQIIEKVSALLGQRNSYDIRIKNVIDNPSTITFYNSNLLPNIHIDTTEFRTKFIVDVSGDNSEQGNQIDKKHVKIASLRFIPIPSC